MDLDLDQTGVKFKQFDCVTDFSDHYFYMKEKTKQKNCHGKMNDKTVKRIMKEWGILEKNLPELILVRVYEGRIDLLRSAIIGAQNTPYHNGLFFFDFKFPSDYPNRPPRVRYHSFGQGLNPNLYNNGYICLSLLNTWIGREAERWNPNKSTILQVLISLQALVLNEKPYYNEFIFRAPTSWEVYNADVFTMSCKTMLFLINNPLRNFQEFIAEHFKEHGSFILRACIAYRDRRVLIGFFNGDDQISSKKRIKVSKKFKKSMDELYPELYKAFNGVGASLNNLPEKMANVPEKRPRGIIGKVKTLWKAMKKENRI